MNERGGAGAAEIIPQFNTPENVTVFDAALNVAMLVYGSRKGKAETLR